MNPKSDENKKPKTSKPTTEGCRMKKIRDLILCLLAGTFLIAGLPGSSLAAGDTTFAFPGDTLSVSFEQILDSTEILSTTFVDSVFDVESGSDAVACKFKIFNISAAADTLTEVIIKSLNDSTLAGALTRVALWKGDDEPTTEIEFESDPGNFVNISPDPADSITLTGLSDLIAAGDSTTYWIVYTFANALDDSLHGAYAGAFIGANGLTLGIAGACPQNANDTLRYLDDQTFDQSTGFEGEGRPLILDLQAPLLDIEFTLTDDATNCVDNGIINLGDSITVNVIDTSVNGQYLPTVIANLNLFGPASSLEVDMVDVSDGTGRLYEIRIPDTVFAGADEYPSGFNAYYLTISATDAIGNTTIDSIQLVDYSIDTKKPVYDGDSTWVELFYDANGDDVAAIGDSIRIHANLTSESEFEIESVVADLSTWELSDDFDLYDQGDNKIFTATAEIGEGGIDTTALNSTLEFTVTAYDNGCNNTVVTALNPFAIDNRLPEGTAVYTMLKDVDGNNIANINDSVKMTVTIDDATTDLADLCEVMVDLQTSGLGGNAYQCVETKVAGDYVYNQGIVYVPQFDQYAVDYPIYTHQVEVTLTDDAGNTAVITSTALPQQIDTRPPLAVTLDNPMKGACAINLSWEGNAGDRYYRIFSDGGDGTWAASDTSADNYVGRADYPAEDWSTDEADTTRLNIEDGKTYQFVIKVTDDADNKEYYTNFFTQIVSSAVDCVAPTACIDTTRIKSGGSYGNELDLIAISTDEDIEDAIVIARDADAGSGTPGPWITIGGMDQVDDGGTFTATLNDDNLDFLGVSSGYLDDTYELITVAADLWGNEQTNSEALAACEYSSPFTFHWFWVDLPLSLVTVNDTVSPQNPDCGYNVARNASNEIVLNVDNFAAGDTFTVDVMAFDTGEESRVFYQEGIDAMPYTVYLNATNFPKGSQNIYITVTRNDGNETSIDFEICVPDENAPQAEMVYPLDGEIVPRICNHLDMLTVEARIDTDSYDPNNVARVEFEEFIGGVWTRFDVVTDSYDDEWYEADWYNCAYNHGDTARLRAVIYDDVNNSYTTASVFVTIDTLAPDISLTIPEARTSCGIEKIGGMIDLTATVNTVYEDVDHIDFFYASADDPDLFDDYVYIGEAEAATSDGIYIYHEFDTDDELTSDKYYRFRAIAIDLAGNVMWDSDHDGLFDDNTFSLTKNSDNLYYVDNNDVDGIVRQVVVTTDAGDTVHVFPTPLTKWIVYAAMGDNLTVESQTFPIADTCDIMSVVYYWNGTEIGVASPHYPYTITFDPVELGLIDPEDIADDYVYGDLGIEFTDIFGNTDTDAIDVYILDITANQALVTEPANNDCVAGEVDLQAMALNGYEIHHVTYKYRAVGATPWIEIGTSADWEEYYSMTWNTVNAGIDDGQYQLAAVATDNSLNEDAAPKYITVNVINTPPTAALTAPADSAFIGYETTFKADVTSGTATKVEFYYKEILDDNWYLFGTDNEAPWEATSDFEDDELDEGWYNIKAISYNCAEGYKDSEWQTFFLDGTDPYAMLTTIAGHDVEGGNDPEPLDLTGEIVVEVAGMFRDDLSSYNSGLARVVFYLTDDYDYYGQPVREKIIDPATAGVSSAKFDISGLDEGTYYFFCQAWDSVGNETTTSFIPVTISDMTAPITAIAGFYPGTIYGYDWSGDAAKVLFEYQSGTEWIGIGIGYEAYGNMWYANWNPEPGTYTVRMKATDYDDNTAEPDALTSTLTVNEDGTFSFTATGLTDMTAMKNYDAYYADGVLGVTSTLGSPLVFAIYKLANGSTYYEFLDMNANLDDDNVYYGSFENSDYLDGGGVGYFFASAEGADGNTMMIQQTTITTYKVLTDLGTNGTVWGNNHTVSLSIPPGAANLVAVILETWMPANSVYDQFYEAFGNSNGLGNYIGCNNYEGYCYLYNSRYATITMPYDALVTTPAESLVVGWWDEHEWRVDNVYQPVFNTTAHTVTFKTSQLFGLFAVLRQKLEPHSSPITIEFLASSCGEDNYDASPTIRARVKDNNYPLTSIDDDRFTVRVDGEFIIIDGDEGDYYDYHYDHVTGILDIYWYGYGHYEDYEYYAEPLSCGDHSLELIAWNNQAQFETETYDFTVDCLPPTVVFENSYVSKNPTITFNVSDDLSGVDLNTIHVDVVAIQSDNTNSDDPQQDEHLFFLQTFLPGQIIVDENGDVSLETHYELEDERAIAVIIYDGDRNGDEPVGDYYYGYGWDEYYAAGDGVHDCVGNSTDPIIQILAIDNGAPAITILGVNDSPPLAYLPGGICPFEIQISDDGSGVAATSVMIYENDALLVPVTDNTVDAEGEYYYNSTTGIIQYCPTSGTSVMMVITDRSGNQVKRIFKPGNFENIVNATVNYTPWDPSQNGNLVISFAGLAGPTTVKIYDFGGDLVKTLSGSSQYVEWNGRTEEGIMVADGVYFAHIAITTTGGSYSTTVKIAVIK